MSKRVRPGVRDTGPCDYLRRNLMAKMTKWNSELDCICLNQSCHQVIKWIYLRAAVLTGSGMVMFHNCLQVGRALNWYSNSDVPWTIVRPYVNSKNNKLSYGRETGRSLILFWLTSSVIRKIMHKIGFLSHSMGASGAIYALYLKFLTKRNLVAEFHRENVSFTRKTAN